MKSGDIVIKEAIGIGDNEVDALNDAKKQLGLDENAEVDFEVIQRAEKKKFGLFGGQPAKVRVTLKETPAEKAEQFLRDVLNNMKLESVMIEKKEIEGGIEFNLSGEDVGFVIGRRGETLDSLQYLTSLVANHSDNSYFKVTIDTGNYREKREKTLEILGRKLAFKAVKTGRKTNLEPMNPYERRIIHSALQGAKAKTQTAMLLSVLIQRQSPFAETAVTTTEAEAADAHTAQTVPSITLPQILTESPLTRAVQQVFTEE